MISTTIIYKSRSLLDRSVRGTPLVSSSIRLLLDLSVRHPQQPPALHLRQRDPSGL